MVYSTRRFVLNRALCYFVLVFFSPFSIAITSLGKRELIIVLFIRLFDLHLLILSVSYSSWCLGRAATFNCGTSWTFSYLFFLHNQLQYFHYQTYVYNDLFCVGLLRPSQFIRIMQSAVSLPNHLFFWAGLVLSSVDHYLCILLPETDNCPSLTSSRERMTVENIS